MRNRVYTVVPQWDTEYILEWYQATANHSFGTKSRPVILFMKSGGQDPSYMFVDALAVKKYNENIDQCKDPDIWFDLNQSDIDDGSVVIELNKSLQ